MTKRDADKWRGRALVIEFWIAMVVVVDSVLTGIGQMLRALF